MDEKLMTLRQVAERLDTTYNAVRLLRINGKLGAVKVGKEWKVTEAAYQEFLDGAKASA